MSGTIESFLQAKYSAGGPGSDRFDPVADEIHASQISDCQRKRKWKHDRDHRSGASPYFELGRVFEMMYGQVLAFEHDPAVDTNTLKSNKPWEVNELTTYIVQDVNVDIDLGDCSIVGEADWVVLGKKCPSVAEPDEYGALDKVRVDEDGDRTAVFANGDALPYSPAWVSKVVETKTKRDVDWVRRKGADPAHVYQVYPYMFAMDTAGEVAYMERNDWSEYVVELDYDPDRWLDCVMRAKRHARNQADGPDAVPPTTPLNDKECKYCDFQHDCRAAGGSKWA